MEFKLIHDDLKEIMEVSVFIEYEWIFLLKLVALFEFEKKQGYMKHF